MWKFPVKIHSFEVKSPNLTNNYLICKDNIQGKIIIWKDVAKLITNILFSRKFPVKIHSFEEESKNVANHSVIFKDDTWGRNYLN